MLANACCWSVNRRISFLSYRRRPVSSTNNETPPVGRDTCSDWAPAFAGTTPGSGDAPIETGVDPGQQPQRADHQKLHVLEEGRASPFVVMTDELADPGDDEDHRAAEGDRPGQKTQPPGGEESG